MALDSLVPMAHVADVARSIAFYERMGFAVRHTHAREGTTTLVWAWLASGGAQLMLALADEPVAAAQQAVLFYVYADDVEGYRAELLGKGVEAGLVNRPFYNPRGEFRVTDPDGYVLMVTHT
jgi:catechol 2,3-dioxygenase-like lactoylglutathione lyase family enzyme